MIMKPMVSVIVPAYNVSKYIGKCISSLLEQTYSETEIIIIDDGSTDNTGSLLDEIKSKHSNITVVHTSNYGVSHARNVGLSLASGDYVTFVDGDDYVSNDYVEYLMQIVENTGAPFCYSCLCFTSFKEKQIQTDVIQSITPTESIALLLSPNVIVGCWNKIYKKQFLIDNHLSFSTDLFYGEGLSFIIAASQFADKIGIGKKKVYYYRRNNESSATVHFDIEKIRNGEIALNRIYNSIQVKDVHVETMYNLHLALFSLGASLRMIQTKCVHVHFRDYMHYRKLLIEKFLMILFSKTVSLYRKTMLVGGILFPILLSKMDSLRRKKISDNSII